MLFAGHDAGLQGEQDVDPPLQLCKTLVSYRVHGGARGKAGVDSRVPNKCSGECAHEKRFFLGVGVASV